MSQHDQILQELNELQSSLGITSLSCPFSLPAGYFNELAERVMIRIRVEESPGLEDELTTFSPALASLPRQMPFTVPDGYFGRSLLFPASSDSDADEEELRSFLQKPPAGVPYTVPEGYFEQLPGLVLQKLSRPAGRVISFSRPGKWLRYAAAAAVTGFIALAAILYYPGKTKEVTENRAWASVEKNILQASDTDLENFVQITASGIAADSTRMADEAGTDLVAIFRDIPDAKLKAFLDETSDDEESLLN